MSAAALIAAIDADLRHPLWWDASDLQLAERHGTTLDMVYRVRAERRANLNLAEIVGLADELADRIGWEGTTSELIEACLRAALRRGAVEPADTREERSHAAR